MARVPAWRSVARLSVWLTAALAVIAGVGAASVIVSGWLIDGVERANGSRSAAAERSDLGSYFDAASAVFSGVALLLLVITLLMQQRELRMQRQELSLQRTELASSRNELRRSAAADLRSLHVQLTQMQMDDPSLAEVWHDYPGMPPEAMRQYLFANLTFGHYLLAYTWGDHTEAEILVYARNLMRSPAFRRYWVASREGKTGLPPDSEEGRLFRIFESAMAQADDVNAQSPPPPRRDPAPGAPTPAPDTPTGTG
ncbi:DUF6082 family protein [Streptomyces sp. NPDC058001]|uniref:DUF6082 family protein n=1 Tax=Streptomyces sp. NPDC058001 TaxID=3346300 RepID=UPI0036EC388D